MAYAQVAGAAVLRSSIILIVTMQWVRSTA